MTKKLILELKKISSTIRPHDEVLARGRERLRIRTSSHPQIPTNAPKQSDPFLLRYKNPCITVCVVVLCVTGYFSYTHRAEINALWHQFSQSYVTPIFSSDKTIKPIEFHDTNIETVMPTEEKAPSEENSTSLPSQENPSSSEPKQSAAVINSDTIETLKQTVSLPEAAQGKKPTSTAPQSEPSTKPQQKTDNKPAIDKGKTPDMPR